MADKTNGFTFIWKIENYSMLPHQNGESLESPFFKVTSCKDVQFQLSLYPRGVKGKEDHAACFLYDSEDNVDLKLKFCFELESTTPTEAIVTKTFDYTPDCRRSGIDYLFNINEIYAMKHVYLPNDILTLRCRLLSAHEAVETIASELDSKDNFQVNSLVCRSEVHVDRRSAMWSIPNINNIGELVEESFINLLSNSPSFKLSIKLSEITTNEFVPIEIRQTMELDFGVFVKCKITVISANKEHRDFNESTHFFPEKSDVWQFPLFIKASSLTFDKYLFPDGTLHLHCVFVFSYENDAVHDTEDTCLHFKSNHNNTIRELSTSIRKCYSIGKYSDIQLQAGGETFEAHRLVLGARSSVFSAMFENDMIEKNSGVVNIVDVDPTTLKRMLSYLYGEEDVVNKHLSLEDVCKLYEAADKYDISSLKYRCWVFLISSLSVASVCHVLVVADAHQDSFLLSAVYNFIDNHAGEILNSSNWKMLMDANLKLASEVMHKLLTEKNLL